MRSLPKDLRQLTPAETRAIVDELASLPLGELRRRQDLTEQQLRWPSTVGVGASNLQIRQRHLDLAIDKREFGHEPNTGSGIDRSEHSNVVEYAVLNLFKRMGPAAAARRTVAKLSGFENMFLGPGVSVIDEKKLERALWVRMADMVIEQIPKMRAGKEDYALDGVIQHFNQSPKIRPRLMGLVVERLGRDPFSRHEPNAGSSESSEPKVGDSVTVHAPGMSQHREGGVIVEIATRRSGSLRYTVETRRGDIYLGANDLRVHRPGVEQQHEPNHSGLRLGAGVVERRATEGLSRIALKAKNRGDLQSATISAAFYAKRNNRTMYLYYGNSFGHQVWRVSDKATDFLSPINNTGPYLYSVTPELVVSRHELARYEPNAGYYVWVLRVGSDEPLNEGPYGPHNLESAKTFARISATEGEHDRAVSRGLDPEARTFEFVRRYGAGTGERII